MSRFEKPETVRRADSVIKGKGSNLIDDPAMKKPEPKPKPVEPVQGSDPINVGEPYLNQPKKPKKKKKGGKRYVNKT